MAAMMTLLSGIFALAIWIPANSYGVLIFYSIIGGAVIGTYWAVSKLIHAQYLTNKLSRL